MSIVAECLITDCYTDIQERGAKNCSKSQRGLSPVLNGKEWSASSHTSNNMEGIKILETFALCDSVDVNLIEAETLTGQSVDLNVAGIHGTSDISTKRNRVTIGDQVGKRFENIVVYSHPNVNEGN